MPLPLIPATLLPGQNNYPAELQNLVNLLAANLFTPEPPKEIFRHTSPNQVPSDSLWLDLRDGTLKSQDSNSIWRTVLSGNFTFGAEADNGALPPGVSLFNSVAAPTQNTGHEISVFKVKPFSAANKILVLGHIPGVSASLNNTNVYATLICNSRVFGISSAITRLGGMQSLLVLGVHTPATNDIDSQGDITYRLRLGTDDSVAAVYYNRKSPTDTFQNEMKVTMIGVQIPI